MYVVIEIICQQIIIAMMQRHEEPWPNVVFTTSGLWKLSLSSCEMYAQLWCCIAQDRDFCEMNINPGPYQAKYQSSIICHLRFQKRCRCKKVQTYLSFITFIEFFNKRTYLHISNFFQDGFLRMTFSSIVLLRFESIFEIRAQPNFYLKLYSPFIWDWEMNSSNFLPKTRPLFC